MNRESQLITPLFLAFIAVIILLIIGVHKKIEYAFEANAYYLYCKVRYDDPQYCEYARKRILQIAKRVKYDRPLPEADRQILSELDRLFLPYQVAFVVVLAAFLFLGGKRTRKKEQKKTAKAPKLFSGEMQKAVDNFYKIDTLSKEEIKLVKEVYGGGEYPPEVAFALFMTLAREKSNFASREVALGIKDKNIRKIIFASGRPSIPPSVLPYFVLAKQILSERRSDGQDRQGQQQSPLSDKAEQQAA
ncbi:hypothetical protein [Persephonella sp.]